MVSGFLLHRKTRIVCYRAMLSRFVFCQWLESAIQILPEFQNSLGRCEYHSTVAALAHFLLASLGSMMRSPALDGDFRPRL